MNKHGRLLTILIFLTVLSAGLALFVAEKGAQKFGFTGAAFGFGVSAGVVFAFFKDETE